MQEIIAKIKYLLNTMFKIILFLLYRNYQNEESIKR